MEREKVSRKVLSNVPPISKASLCPTLSHQMAEISNLIKSILIPLTMLEMELVSIVQVSLTFWLLRIPTSTPVFGPANGHTKTTAIHSLSHLILSLNLENIL